MQFFAIATSCALLQRLCKLTRSTDEPEEVEVVESQLNEHLDMDPQVTLGVLCDQIVPTEDFVDEDDQVTREQLRSLVLGFMVGKAKRAILERHAEVAQKVLVEGPAKVSRPLLAGDAYTIVIISSTCPSYDLPISTSW